MKHIPIEKNTDTTTIVLSKRWKTLEERLIKEYNFISQNEQIENSKMDVYRGKKVLLESGSLGPACVIVQNGKILQVHEGFQFPKNLEDKM